MVSLLACGSDGGGNNASSNGQSPFKAEGVRYTANSENPLIGTWISGGYSLIFKSDNTYMGGLMLDGTPEVWGNVVISGNVVIFSEAVGSNSSGPKDSRQIISGSYTYTINGNILTFSPVLDVFRDQSNMLCLSYQKR